MKSPTLQTPSVNVGTDEHQPLVIVRLNLPQTVLTPAANYLGPLVLKLFLESATRGAGATIHAAGCAGQFNDSLYFLKASPLPVALDAVVKAMDCAGFLAHCRVAWLCEQELILRTYHPNHGGTMPMEWDQVFADCAFLAPLAQLAANPQDAAAKAACLREFTRRERVLKPSAPHPLARHPRWNLFLHGLAAISAALFRRNPRLP